MGVVKQFENNYAIRFKFVDILANYGQTEELRNYIIEDILKNFRHDEECMYKCLTYKLNVQLKNSSIEKNELIKTEKETLESLIKVCKTMPSAKMWEYLSQFCLDAIFRHREESEIV